MNTVTPPTFGIRRYFSIASGAAILLAVILMSLAYHYSEVREQTTLTGMRNETLARTYANTLWPDFGQFLLRSDIDPAVRRELDETRLLDSKIRQMARDVPMVKIKVYNLDGVAVYSSVLREIGENKSQNSGFLAAREGRQVNELAHRGKMSATEGEIQDVDVVSSYIPIRLQPDEPVQAVFELYSNVTETVARIETVSLQVLAGLAAVSLVLYWILLWIVGRADRILRFQYVAIKDNEARLQAKTAELEREIVERREIEAALRRSEEVAAAASRAKSDFLSGMSHELRTPMNAILGFAQLLETEPGTSLSTEQRKFLHQIMKAGEHLLGLINQVLDLARIEAGKLSLSIERVTLQSVLDEALPLVQTMATQRQLAPFTVDTRGLSVQGDYVRLKQVLLNLLSNAVKYNRVGGHVSVNAVPVGDKVRISVTDTGPGIPSGRIGELFQPFSRLGVQSAEVEGTGIGLTLSKLMVEAMGGRIGVDSTPGVGSTFWVELPCQPAEQPAATPSADPASDRLPLTASGAAGTATVLYVEDNPANLMLMQELVRRMDGVRLISAHNAELGIVLASQEKPDLIIMDINLPGMNGFEALQQLRRQPATADIPVMAVSANAMPSDVARGVAAGFAGYHTKPIQLDVFSQAIRDALAGVHA